MLTPKQISSHQFEMAGKAAYKAADVDAFLDEVYESYETMYRENGELVKKLNLVADKLASYKADEDNIRNALLTAERMKESIVAEAQDQIKGVLEEANQKADDIINRANEKAEDALRIAQSNATKLLSKAQDIYDEQVGSAKDEAEREEAYLLHIKEESAKVRADLMDTYKRQIQMLEFTPDFSEEVAEARAKRKLKEVVEEEEIEEVEEIEEDDDNIIEFEEEDDEIEVEIEEYVSEDAEDSEEEEEEFEDIDSGKDLFEDDDDEEKASENGEISLF